MQREARSLHQEGLFDTPPGGRHHRRHGLLRRLAATMASIAADAGSVIDDERELEIARLIAGTLQDPDTADGLTRSQILERAARPGIPAPDLDARFDVLVKLEMLLPVLDKRHQERYLLNPAGLVGILMVDRAASRGGIDEVLMLLSRTREEVDRSQLTASEVARRLRDIRGVLAVMTAHLDRLTRTATLEELIDARDQQDIRVVNEVRTLCDLVSARFSTFEAQATRAVEAALRYMSAVEATVVRLLSEGARSQDFSILSPEDYRTAALTAGIETLAAVVSEVAFDPPRVWVEAADIIEAMQAYSPSAHARVPPPEVEELDLDDPLIRLEQAAADEARWLDLDARHILEGGSRADVTPPVSGIPWDQATATLSRLFRTDARPELGYRLEFADGLRVTPDGDVTHASPAELITVEAESSLNLHVLDGGAEIA
jgi:hypothetical protein